MTDQMTHLPWPQTGTPVVPGVASTGFGVVTWETLMEMVRRITTSLHPEKIILFGSYASGHPSPDSDVDLLVILESDLNFAERQVIVSRLIRPRPFPVDILVYTPQEVAEALQKENVFLKDVLDHGKVLYGTV